MNEEYRIEVKKGKVFWKFRVDGYNGMDFIGAPTFVRFTYNQAKKAAIVWCNRHDKKINAPKDKFIYTP